MAETDVTPEQQPAEDQITETASPEQESVDYEALYRRALADAENARKRQDEEKRQFAKYAQEGLIEELLPVVDNFYRATEHVPSEQKDSPWTAGILHIRTQLLGVLEAAGVTEIPAKAGDSFDAHRHEAIGTVEQEGEEDRIVEVKNRGYLLKDRLLRPTQVIVSTSTSTK